MSAMNRLRQLGEAGVAVWLDFVSREFLNEGGLKKHVDEDGLTGVTSNPSIFEKAMGHGTAYDAGMNAFLKKGDVDACALYEHLAVEDIQQAADILRPTYDRLEGRDGYVSMEVLPYLATDTQATLLEARRLWGAVNRPNLMIKVPGTPEGAIAVRQLIEEGINVNVTLLFSRDAYLAVAQAYTAGLEARVNAGKEIKRIAGVASFFVSRIDAQIDKKIDQIRSTAGAADQAVLDSLKGKVAIANAKLAYQDYLHWIDQPRWKALESKGAQPQRLLWASTGTKNPAYPETLYVDQLIGPDTVNTIPPATLAAFQKSGTIAPTLTHDIEGARKVLADADRLKLDLAGVTKALLEDGAKQFADAADALLAAIAAKRIKFLGNALNGVGYSLPEALQKAVDAQLEKARTEGWSRRLWAADASLWTGRDEAGWLGWLAAGQGHQVDVRAVAAMAAAIQSEGYKDAVLLGMGGSSLGPEVLAGTLGATRHGLMLHVLDSTDPAQIAEIESKIDIAKTLFIVSSKSGSTLEPQILDAYFREATKAAVGEDQTGRHFIAVTDPKSKLEAQARKDGFRAVFLGDPTIGGRSSVLSVFGMVPLGVLGHDVQAFSDATQPMVRSCAPGVPPQINPGVHLGAVMGASVLAGRDKITFFTSKSVAGIGSWLEQLLAESTGKQGKGIIPVDHEPIGASDVYGKDRLFVYVRVATDDAAELDAKVRALEETGQPVVRITLKNGDLIGQEFFRWETATAIAGAIIGINPFDQPDVETSKLKTRALTDAYEKSGKLDAETPFADDGNLSFYGDAALRGDGSAAAIVRAHLARLTPGDYAALLAYIQRNDAHEIQLEQARRLIRDRRRVATVVGFGPRFLHSTGQAYKGGPNTGVFLQITADPAHDLVIPGRQASFGVVQAAQARGDLDVLTERGRRTLRIHIRGGDVDAGLARIVELVGDGLA
jgi:transaldolase/glucose-6-phosphate isomerase